MGRARRYVGTNPFRWIGDDTSLALGTTPTCPAARSVTPPRRRAALLPPAASLWLTGAYGRVCAGTAMYDLMGKAVGVPVWQLIGPQQRAYVPVGSWTVSAAPAHMAEAVQRYQARGYVSAAQLPLRRPPEAS